MWRQSTPVLVPRFGRFGQYNRIDGNYERSEFISSVTCQILRVPSDHQNTPRNKEGRRRHFEPMTDRNFPICCLDGRPTTRFQSGTIDLTPLTAGRFPLTAVRLLTSLPKKNISRSGRIIFPRPRRVTIILLASCSLFRFFINAHS